MPNGNRLCRAREPDTAADKCPRVALRQRGTGGLSSPFQGLPGAYIGGSDGGGSIAKGPDGKPVFFFAGAEYCPYFAAERWSMVMALSRFGTISNLTLSASTGSDVYPNTPTFTFVGSSYTSKYIDFQSVEGRIVIRTRCRRRRRSSNSISTSTTRRTSRTATASPS